MSILHINSSARLENLNTRIIGQYLVDALVAGFHFNAISGAA